MSPGGIKVERGFRALAQRSLTPTLIPAKPPRRSPRNWRSWMTVLCIVAGVALLAGIGVWGSSCQKKPAPATAVPREVIMVPIISPTAAPVLSPSPTPKERK